MAMLVNREMIWESSAGDHEKEGKVFGDILTVASQNIFVFELTVTFALIRTCSGQATLFSLTMAGDTSSQAGE
jgi:hypothetical protein